MFTEIFFVIDKFLLKFIRILSFSPFSYQTSQLRNQLSVFRFQIMFKNCFKGTSKPSNGGGIANLPVIPIGSLKNGGSVSPRNGSSPGTPMGNMKNFSSIQQELSRKMAFTNNGQNQVQNQTTTVENRNEPKNFGNIQMELKKQLANDNRNRGPPPPTPTRTVSIYRPFMQSRPCSVA